VLLYWTVCRDLVSDWNTDDNYSHGFFIIPLSAFFLWERRADLAAARQSWSALGLVLVLLGVLVLLAGLLGADRFLPRVSLLMVLTGTVWFLWGWQTLRVAAFPLAFLTLMVPLPALLFNQIAFPLQLVASQAGELVLAGLGIPVLREGNVIILAHTTLEVAEACSGIRSLISLLTLGIVFAYFTDPRGGVRAAIALSTIPIAIVANAARVAGTGVAAHYYGDAAAQGFFHTFSGWIVFIVAFALVLIVARLLLMVLPMRTAAPVPA
jgi:exosortase